MVTTGQVERKTWWKGTETSARDTLLMAMFKVKSELNATRMRFSRSDNLESLSRPVSNRMVQPIEVEKVCEKVSSQGYDAYRSIST